MSQLELLLYQAGKGGELTHDETTIISGALDLTEKVYIIFVILYVTYFLFRIKK
jgi:hypothetical protein